MRAALQSWTQTNPLIVLAFAAVSGVLGAECGISGLDARLLAFAALAFPIAALITGRAWLLIPSCVVVFAFIHTARLGETFEHPLRTVLPSAGKPAPATMTGRLLPHFDSFGDERTRAICLASEIRIPSRGAVVTHGSTVLVRLPRGLAFPGAGVFVLDGRIHLPRTSSNPGAFDAENHALRNGRVALFDVESFQRIGKSGGILRAHFLEAAETCRRWISRQLTRDIEDDPQKSAVIRAMALGIAAEADEEIENAFRNSGTLHVFAVSGLHVGLLGVIVLTMLRQLGTRRSIALWLTIGVVFSYAFITGWRPSAARAAFMVAVFLAASLVDRESSLQNSLGAAALILLGADTHQLFMPGFQLSFGVLWFIAIGSTVIIKRLSPFTELDPFLPPQLADWRQQAWCKARRWLAGTLSVSISAWIGSLPFILLHFQTVTPVAVIANCVLVPLSFLCLSTACLSLCAAALHLTGVQIVLNNANWALASAMVTSAAWFASLPGASFHLQPAASASQAPVVWRVLEAPYGGAAHHLRTGQTHWLFDTGNEASFRHTLRPCLRASGVNAIAGVFLSHNDADHVGAVERVFDEFGRPVLFCSTQEPGPQDSALTTLRRVAETSLSKVLQRLEVDAQVPLPGAGDFKVAAVVLHPSRQVISARADDRAMVLMLSVGPWRLLWMNDAGWNTEKLLSDGAADLRCDVLIRNQHSLDHDMSSEFLSMAAPRVIICGNDNRDQEALLPESLVKLAKSQNIELFETLSDGSIEIGFDSTKLSVQASRSGRQRTLTEPHLASRRGGR